MEHTKFCAYCNNGEGADKPISAFHITRANKDGLSNRCRECSKLKGKLYRSRPEVKLRANEYQKQWTKQDRKKRPEVWKAKGRQGYERHKRYRERTKRDQPEKWRRMQKDSDLKKKFGITLAEYEILLAQQDHRCALCNRHDSELSRNLAVDHCHETAAVRKLLCASCNTGLGCFRDDVELLRKAIVYILKCRNAA